MAADLDELKKQAEIKKLKSEIAKINSEKLKADFDYHEAKKKADKKWWATSTFGQRIVSAFLGVSILGFYITYGLLPAFNLENILIKTENAKKSEELRQKETMLDSVSKDLNLQRIKSDSIKNNLDKREKKIAQLGSSLSALKQQYKQMLESERIRLIAERKMKEVSEIYGEDLKRLLDRFQRIKPMRPLEAKVNATLTFTFKSKGLNLEKMKNSYNILIKNNGTKVFEGQFDNQISFVTNSGANEVVIRSKKDAKLFRVDFISIPNQVLPKVNIEL